MKRFFAIIGTLPILVLAGLIVRKFVIDPMELLFLGALGIILVLGITGVFCLGWLIEDFKKRKTANKPLDE